MMSCCVFTATTRGSWVSCCSSVPMWAILPSPPAGSKKDSVSSVAATAPSTVLGLFWRTANTTCGFDRFARYWCRASCCLPSASSFGNALSGKAQKSSPKSAQLSVFYFLLVLNLAAYNSRRLSGSKHWRRASTRSLNDTSHTSGLSCLYAACGLRQTRSHRVFSSFHLLIRATPMKWSSQSVKLPSPLKASGMMMGLLTLTLPTMPSVSRFCGRAPGSRQQSQRTSMHQESIAKPTGSSNAGIYIVCVSPLDKGCCSGTKPATCVIC